ncbi:winged helix-turn-helix transcriptional regulator [Pseudonocardia acaciae]|uniref:winged helix-turn-helix transcriptional regulator n=1 Tax=Pseudonocardia acaciae TaxID=551276 RepID=UPI0004916C54|nr:helix-turn-helix domain-containing protein [Pseudonocardia acaciae]
MPVQRGYRQACGMARALDLVGERWALLIVRELLLGPKRFTDLRAALPGASPNAVTDRLRELTEAGVLRRRRLAPPSAAWVYELTDWGRRLEPILLDLGTWALAAAPREEQRFVSVDSLMLTVRTYFAGDPDAPPATLEVRVAGEAETGFGIWLRDGRADVRHDRPDRPDAVITTDAASLVRALADRGPAGITAAGDGEVLARLVEGMAVPGPG